MNHMIDTHCHLWNIEKNSWIQPHWTAYRRSFDENDLAAAVTPMGVDGCVFIEAGPTRMENDEQQRMSPRRR